MSFPLTGETVKIQYLEMDELEVTCWLEKYKVNGYLDNSRLNLPVNLIGTMDEAQISSVNNGRVSLKK